MKIPPDPHEVLMFVTGAVLIVAGVVILTKEDFVIGSLVTILGVFTLLCLITFHGKK